MSSYFCGSAEAARQLREDTVRQVKVIVDAWKSFAADYSRYAPDIKDGSSDKIFEYQQKAAKLMESVMDDVSRINQRLVAYEIFVEKATKPYNTKIIISNKKTSQRWSSNGGSTITFDSPDALGKHLETSQKYGNCGLCSVQNVAYMAGIKTDQDTMLNYAKSKGLCDECGGTQPEERRKLLKELGIDSYTAEPTIDNIVAAVMSGRGVIVSVQARPFYNYSIKNDGYHAVTVTSVVLDENGNPTEIIVCDSNADDIGDTGARRCSVEFFKNVMSGKKLNITEVIR